MALSDVHATPYRILPLRRNFGEVDTHRVCTLQTAATAQKTDASKIDYLKPTMADQHIVLSLKRFLLIEECPAPWKSLDLYLFRDEAVVFYVGQSYLAFARVWEHLRNGFKGRSVVGRFVWCNWPKSMNFTIELLNSQAAQFDVVGNDLNAAERWLIQQTTPCFNAALNSEPTPLPAHYCPPTSPIRCSRSLNKLTHEAERAVQAEERRRLMQEINQEINNG